jgi:predicted outer membrane repeat protein
MKHLRFLPCLFFGASLLHAGVIKIPADYPTIQAGITAAVPGDTILLAPGVYTGAGNRDIMIPSKKFCLLSEAGAAATIIDCQGTVSDQHQAFRFTSGGGTSHTIEGITVRHGYGYLQGGALYISNASPTFKSCVFSDNAGHHGGGFYITGSGSLPSFFDCVFTRDSAGDIGGSGLCRDHGNAHFENCIFESNVAANGAFLCWHASPTLVGCRFSNNVTTSTGGAVFLQDDCDPTFANCLFENNTTHGFGGAIYNDERCAMGGSSQPVITNCTFVGNAGPMGAVLYNDQHSQSCQAIPVFTNCILAYNTGSPAVVNNGGNPLFSCSDIYGNPAGNWTGVIASQATINGNFSADPLFCNAAAGNWYLLAESPCAPTNNACHTQIGLFGVGCSNRRIIIDPDTMYLFYAQAIVPMSGSIYIGDLPDGHSAADIDTASIVINGSLAPTAHTLLFGYPDLTGRVLRIDFLIENFLDWYGLIWDTAVVPLSLAGEYLDDSPFSVTGELTVIGHRAGDINGDGLVNIGDPVYLIGYVFRNGPPPAYPEMGNVNGDEQVNIGDAVYIISYLFRSGPPPVPHRGE